MNKLRVVLFPIMVLGIIIGMLHAALVYGYRAGYEEVYRGD